MLSLSAIGILFPAIPLAIVALNFRYTSLAGLMREIHAQLDKKGLETKQRKVLSGELDIMARRMSLVKYSLFFLGLSFVANLVALLVVLNQGERFSIVYMNITIVVMVAALCFCGIETVLSTKARRMHLHGSKSKNQTQLQHNE